MKSSGRAANDRCEAEAAAWYVSNQVQEDDVDETLVQRWEEWWDNAENRAAYVSIIELGREASSLPRPPRASDEDLQNDLRELSGLDAEYGKSQFASRQHWLTSLPRSFAISVCLLVVLVGSLLLFRKPAPDVGRTYATAAGEQRSFALEDGSTMTLGGATSVNVRFNSAGRMVVLTRGEGMFRVQHETDRPFSVCAASGCTTAVGTVFDVRLYSNHTRVWVQEGAVLVTPLKVSRLVHNPAPDLIGGSHVRLATGQAVTYDSGGRSGSASVVDPIMAGGWTAGSLVYFARPLGEVLEDVQRYTSRKLNVDADVAILLYSGSVLQRHIDQWIRGLPRVFPVAVVDCHKLEESIGSEAEEVTRACASNPDLILIRPR